MGKDEIGGNVSVTDSLRRVKSNICAVSHCYSEEGTSRSTYKCINKVASFDPLKGR